MATKVLACHFMKLVYQFKLDRLDCRNCSLLHFGSRQCQKPDSNARIRLGKFSDSIES